MGGAGQDVRVRDRGVTRSMIEKKRPHSLAVVDRAGFGGRTRLDGQRR
jgi:hypothetical protein